MKELLGLYFLVFNLLSSLAVTLKGLDDVALASGPLKITAEEAKSMTYYRSRHRRTISGHLCTAAFVQAPHTFVDCSTGPTPDGLGNGQEWCYVEEEIFDIFPKGWDYCMPYIDYNRLRLEAKKFFDEKSTAIDGISKKIDLSIKRLENELVTYESVCGLSHTLLTKEITQLEKKINHTLKSIQEIEKSSQIISDENSSAEDIISTLPSSSSLLSTLTSPLLSSPLFSSSPSPSPYLCVSKDTPELPTQGLLASYYPNPRFKGPEIAKRVDERISFDWFGHGPVSQIPPGSDFSIRWDGLIRFPESGLYNLELESDTGGRIFVDERAVFADGMKDSWTGDKEVPVRGALDERRRTLTKRHYDAGRFYKIRVEMFHAQYLDWSDALSSSFCRLLWTLPNGVKELVASDALFVKK